MDSAKKSRSLIALISLILTFCLWWNYHPSWRDPPPRAPLSPWFPAPSKIKDLQTCGIKLGEHPGRHEPGRARLEDHSGVGNVRMLFRGRHDESYMS